jgi:hypothetical protein
MSFLSRVLGGFTLIVALLISNLAAQENAGKEDPKAVKEKDKKDPDKKEAAKGKDDDKKDLKKKDDKKQTTKKDKDDQEPKKDEEKVVWGAELKGKLKQLDANSQKDFTLEVMVPDPKKILELSQWKAQQLAGIAQSRDINDRRNRTANYQRELVQRSLPASLQSPQDLKLRAGDKIQVRSLYPPVDYDDKGNLKRWTAKELAKLKGTSRLPGYPAQFDALRPGQLLSVYLAKPVKQKSGSYGAKKKFAEEDDELGPMRPEAVMIVILLEAAPR